MLLEKESFSNGTILGRKHFWIDVLDISVTEDFENRMNKDTFELEQNCLFERVDITAAQMFSFYNNLKLKYSEEQISPHHRTKLVNLKLKFKSRL